MLTWERKDERKNCRFSHPPLSLGVSLRAFPPQLPYPLSFSDHKDGRSRIRVLKTVAEASATLMGGHPFWEGTLLAHVTKNSLDHEA
jgi:hypothetical protein